MKIKTPFGGEVEFDPTLCSKTMPDEDGVLKSGYAAVCPKSKGQFEVRVTITGVGTKAEQATVEAVPVQAAALLANKRNAVSDGAQKAVFDAAVKAAADTTKKMLAVAEAAGVDLPPTMAGRIHGTVVKANLQKGVAVEMDAYDKTAKAEQKVKAVTDKKLADDALARAGG